MSIINEALKKARSQNAQQTDHIDNVFIKSLASDAPGSKNSIVAFIGVIVAVIVIVSIAVPGVYFLLKPPASASAAVTQISTTTLPHTSPASHISTPLTTTHSTSAQPVQQTELTSQIDSTILKHIFSTTTPMYSIPANDAVTSGSALLAVSPLEQHDITLNLDNLLGIDNSPDISSALPSLFHTQPINTTRDSTQSVTPGPKNTSPKKTTPTTQPVTISPQSFKPVLTDGAQFIRTVNVTDLPRLTLNGIAWSRHVQIALINGMTLKAGDSFDGINVLKVESRQVQLKANNKTFCIRVK